MTKSEAIANWRALDADMPILGHMTPIPYKATGSTYGTCGIRIDGNPAFIEAVLSHLKELLDGEGVETRLGLARNKVDCKLEGHSFHNKETDAEVCYIRLHERGQESAHFNRIVSAARARAKARKANDDDEVLD